jgi:alginate O-acetyltransferase complex protein AlgI
MLLDNRVAAMPTVGMSNCVVFSSTIFLFLFLPLALAAYFMAPASAKNAVLLCASLLFYAWGEGWLVLLLLGSTAFNHVIAGLIAQQVDRSRAIAFLGVGVFLNLALLGYYKYANFLAANFGLLSESVGFSPIAMDHISLPIGISFFTFQSISYLIDIHRGAAEPPRKFVDTALYISLFPQLIAGPIVRYHDVAKQLRNRRVTLDLFSDGVRRFIIGLGKKVLIANPLGFTADQIFAIPGDELTWEISWLGILCYTLQIYFDFSGYSDMAIGLGKMFGFRFLENFNYPYIARSIRDFWRRWHISLSNWFRDYLYVPLGGNKAGQGRLYANLVIVFLLCGLWHGASWTFVVWGLYHGFFLVLERLGLDRIINRLWRPLQHLYMLLVVMVGWVFFRSDDFQYAGKYLSAMFGMGSGDHAGHPIGIHLTNEVALLLLIGGLGATGFHKYFVHPSRNESADSAVMAANNRGAVLFFGAAEAVYLSLVFSLVAIYLAAGAHNPFIYFRF